MSTTPEKVMFLGDSKVAETWHLSGGFKERFFLARPDFQSTGSAAVNYSMPFVGRQGGFHTRYYHAGYNGYTIANLTAILSTIWSTATGVNGEPTIVVPMAGVNDVNTGRTYTQMLTDLEAQLDAIHALSATCKIVIPKQDNELYGAPTSNTTLSNFNSGIAALVTARSSYCYGPLTMPFDYAAAEFSDAQGVHLNAAGNKRKAVALVAGFATVGL